MPEKSIRRPRIGVPWCSAAGEKAGKRRAYDRYLGAVSEAGGEPVEVSLLLSDDELKRLAQSLDAVMLTGSAADIDPRRYGADRNAHTADPDRRRERTDDLLLDHAFDSGKPVLAICYGAQLLNVHLHGTLVQDIPSEVPARIAHEREGPGGKASHPVRIESGRLAKLVSQLSGVSAMRVNSSHHQSILQPGRGLRVTASAPDGVVEAVEWIAGPQWIVGVQWHPERMRGSARQGRENRPEASEERDGDALAGALFRQLIVEARVASEAR